MNHGKIILALCAIGLTIAVGAYFAQREDAWSIDAADLEAALPADVRDNGQGQLFDVRCVERDEQTFRCSGDLRASMQAVKDELSPANTSDFTKQAWQELRDSRSGLMTFHVDVYDDGNYTYKLE